MPKKIDKMSMRELRNELREARYITRIIVGGPMPLTPESLREIADHMEKRNNG